MLQHDHHCVVRFDGSNWRIARVRKHLLDLVTLAPGLGGATLSTTIDISKMDFEAYCATAAAWDELGDIKWLN